MAEEACQQLGKIEQHSGKKIGAAWKEWVLQAQAGAGRMSFAWLRKSGQIYREAEVLS